MSRYTVEVRQVLPDGPRGARTVRYVVVDGAGNVVSGHRPNKQDAQRSADYLNRVAREVTKREQDGRTYK